MFLRSLSSDQRALVMGGIQNHKKLHMLSICCKALRTEYLQFVNQQKKKKRHPSHNEQAAMLRDLKLLHRHFTDLEFDNPHLLRLYDIWRMDSRALKKWVADQFIKVDAGGYYVEVPFPCIGAEGFQRIRVHLWDATVFVERVERYVTFYVAHTTPERLYMDRAEGYPRNYEEGEYTHVYYLRS